MEKEKIDRINELARLAKERELTEEERASLYKSLTAISDGLERLAAERKEQ